MQIYAGISPLIFYPQNNCHFPLNPALTHFSCPSYLPSWALCPLAVTPLPFIPYCHPPLLLVVTFLPLILSCLPVLYCLPLSSCWLYMLPYSGLCRGRLERLRCSGGDWQCSRHHTQPGRKILVYKTLSPPLPALPLLWPLSFFSFLDIFPPSLPSCLNFVLCF